MKLRINCTKETLNKAIMCGFTKEQYYTPNNCWISLAVRELFPLASVCYIDTSKYKNLYCYAIYPFGAEENVEIFIPLPKIAVGNIIEFDRCRERYTFRKLSTDERIKHRKTLEPFSFDIEVSDEILEIALRNINIKSLDDILKGSLNLEKV